MAGDFFDSPSLTVALAMAVGMTAQAIATHLRLPGIVLLLAVGVVLGPDVANIVRPQSMGDGLHVLVGFAVAIILFEGGLNLRIAHLRHQAVPIRRLVSIGAVVTAVGGALAAKGIMGWDWRISALFGTLVIVTGPTVITPLVRRLRLKQRVATVLEAEGILIDAIGATIAVVALEVALTPTATSFGLAVPGIALRIGGGAFIGAAGGGLLALLLYWRHVIPRGLENVVTLAFAVAVFQISNGLLHESGITAAIVAGFVVGNIRSYALGDIVEFKEQLTVLLIATLFVLLAADVRMADIYGLGWRGVATVVVLMIVVRPITVAVSTARTELSRNEKLLIAWMGPRGIVAAAVASLFAISLDAHGIAGGGTMRALVFLVIAMTVTLQGLTSGFLAGILGLRRASNLGYLFLGSNPLSRTVAGLVRDAGEQVVFVDASPQESRKAEEAGFTIVYGNGLEERTLLRARADSRSVAVGVTPNESVNWLFVKLVHDDFYGPKLFVALESAHSGVTAEMVRSHEADLLFGVEANLGWWASSIEHSRCLVVWHRYQGHDSGKVFENIPPRTLLPLAVRRGKQISLAAANSRLVEGDRVAFLVHDERAEDLKKWLGSHDFDLERSAPPAA